MVFGRLHDSNGGAGTESVQGSSIMQQASSMGPTAVVLVKGPPVAAPGTRAAVLALTARLEKAAGGDRRGQRLHQPGRPGAAVPATGTPA